MRVTDVLKPPIELRQHFFTEVKVKANTTLTPEMIKEGQYGYDIKLDLEVSKIPGDSSDYQVQLTITTEELPGHLKGYDVRISVVGFVTVDPSYDEKRQRDTVAILGPTLLYGSVREFLYAVTLRGPFPSIYLPTTSFIPAARPVEEAHAGKKPIGKKAAPSDATKTPARKSVTKRTAKTSQ